MRVRVPEQFAEVVERAIVRLSYLYPSLDVTYDEPFVSFTDQDGETAISEEQIRKEVFHQLYREKIYVETLPIRRWLYSDDD